MLAINLERLERKDKVMYYEEMHYWSKMWKDSEEYGFLKEIHSQTIQQKLKDLSKAFKDCFDKKQPNKKLPRFKKKGLGDSFRYPQGVKVEGNIVYLPKVGAVRFRKSRDIEGIIKNSTISKKGKYWYISLQVEYEAPLISHPNPDKALGLDMGIKSLITTSDGNHILGSNIYRRLEGKLRKEQQKLSRKKRGSNNSKKQKLKLSRVHEKIGNVRNDLLHKITTDISKSHATIFVEDLIISNMSRSAKGTIEEPGSNIKSKSGLNKSILDQGWYKLNELLSYKLDWLGGRLIKVPPKNTSIRCNNCGTIEKSNRISQSSFKCVSCSHEAHADINAAQNILAAGLAVLACESNLIRGRKQEPLAAS